MSGVGAHTRRLFIKQTGMLVAGLAGELASSNAILGDFTRATKDEEDNISPAEDLMREHGVLKRVLLMYDEAVARLGRGQEVSPDIIRGGAEIVRTFIENYHEKLEEDYLFPRFEKAHKLVALVAILRTQHERGRLLTARVIQLATAKGMGNGDSRRQLVQDLHQFTRMYNPHEAREDTVLFPALHTVVSTHEYASLGEEFEKKEHQLFGREGFELYVEKVDGLEKALGIEDLSQFTPVVQ